MPDDDCRNVIRRLFTVAGSRLEAATASAGAGQASSLTADQATRLANELASTAQEVVALGDAIVLIAADIDAVGDTRS